MQQPPSSLLETTVPREFSADEQEMKRVFYEKMSPRRRKFIDRIGFDVWDPFEAPKEPMDIRQDVTKRTAAQLVQDFERFKKTADQSGDYKRGVLECAVAMVAREEKMRGIFDFCLWYHDLLQKERKTT